MFDYKRYKALAEQKNWTAVHGLLDDWRAQAVTPDELLTELYFRVGTFEDQGLYTQAHDLLQIKGHFYQSQAHAAHTMARVLTKLGREQDAFDVMSRSPYEAEMAAFPIWALDAKFFHVVLLAKAGDPSARDRLNEIPDGYIQITVDGDDLVTKEGLIASLDKR